MNTTLLCVLLPALLAIAGLTIDGGQVLVVRREAQALADASARAGAAEIDEAALRSNPADPPVLDPAAAAVAATSFLAEVQPRASIDIAEVDADHIRVRVTSPPISLTLLRLVGLSSVRVDASARAVPRTGITAVGQ